MSSIHYKFKSTLEYKTLTFNGLNISIEELKRLVSEKENIRTESFDLNISNAHTKREYTSDDLVPRNSSVIVTRIPRENALKLPKVHDTSTSGIVGRSCAAQSARPGYIPNENFSKMSEEERLAHIKGVSYEKYSPANYSRRPSASLSIPPPPTYVCNRCSSTGHWSQKCPLLNVRRTTGIPFEELVETTKEDPHAMYHPSGKFVVPIMHELARKNRKKEALFDPSQPGTSTSGSPAQQEEDRSAPSELACSICKCLLRDAVLAICCGDSFCADCIQQKVLEDPLQKCPGSGCLQISTDSLVPNNKMRLAVQKFLSNQYSKTDSAPTVGASSGLLHKLLPDLVASSTASAPTQPSSSTIATTTAAGSITLSEQKPPAGAPPSSKVHQPSIQSSTVSSHHHQAPPKRAPASSSVPPPTSTVPASLGVAAKPLPFPVNLSVPPPPIPSRVVPSATFPSMTRPPPQSQMGIPIPHQQSSTFPPASAPSMAATRGAIPLHLGTAPQQQQQQQHQRDHQGINDAWDAFVRRKDEVGPRKACELAFLSDIQDKLRKQTSLHPPGAESPKNSPSSGSSRTSSSTPPRPRHHHHSRHHPYASGRRDSRRGHSPSPPQQYRRQYHHGGRGVGGLRRGGRTLPSRMPPSSRRLSPSPSRSARKNEPPSQPESAVAINIHGQSELMPPGIALSPTTTKESKRRLGRGHARRRSKSPDERREVSPPPKLDVSEERSRDRTSSKRERHQSGSKFDKGTVAAKDPKVDRAKRREKRDKAKRNVKEGESAEGKNNEKASPPSNIKDSSPPPPIQAGGTRKRKKHLDVLQDGGDQKPAKVLKHRRHSKRAGKSHEEQGEKKEVAQVAEVDVNVKDIAQEPLKKEREKHIAEKGAGESLTSTTETRVAAADERKLTMESLDSEGADTIHGSSASQMAGECGPRLPPISTTTTSDKAEETGGTKPTAPVDYPVTKWKPLPEVRDGDLDRIEGRETSAIIVKETSQMKEGEHPPKEKAPSPTSTSTTMAAARTKKITKNTDDELASRMGVINQLDSRPSLDDGDAEGQKEKSLHRSHKKKKASKHRRKHRREHRKSSEESGHRSREHSHHRRSKSGERKKREDGPRKKSKSKSLGGDRDRDEHSEEQKYTARKERRSHDEKRQRKKKHSSRREQQHSRHHRSSKHCTSREGEVSDGDERKNQDVKGELTEKARPQRDTNPDTDFRSLHRRQIDSAESSQRDVTGVKGPSRKNSTAEATSRARSVPQQIVVTIPSI